MNSFATAGNNWSPQCLSLNAGPAMDDERATTDIVRLVAEHYKEVYRYAYRLTGSEPDAEDLCQQVFLKAQQKLFQLRSAQSSRSWLFAILRNSFFKSCQKRCPIPAGNLDLNVDTVAEEIPEEAAIDRQQLQWALDQLPRIYRLVLTMFYFEDCSYREIADQLQVPMGTVMSRLARAKQHLRAKLFESVVHVAPGQ